MLLGVVAKLESGGMFSYVQTVATPNQMLEVIFFFFFSIAGVAYTIPVCVWLQENHPHVPPLVFVKPTSSMAIKPSHHVDTNGKVYLPFLHEWSHVCILNYYHCSSIQCIYRASDISRKKKQNFAGFSVANSWKNWPISRDCCGKKVKIRGKIGRFQRETSPRHNQ